MLKERYEKPVIRPAEQDNGLLREEYQRPDMEVVTLRTTTVIVTSGSDPVPDTTTTTTTTTTWTPTLMTTTHTTTTTTTTSTISVSIGPAAALVPPVSSIRL